MNEWRSGCNGAGKLNWFVLKKGHGSLLVYHENSQGKIRKYGSKKAADKIAAKLNQK